MGIDRFLILAGLLFAIGLYGTLSRRNIIAVLMSIEIMLSGVSLTFISFSRFINPASARLGNVDPNSALIGQTFVVFIAVVAAAEVALGLALVIAFFRHRDTVDVSDMNFLRH